MSDKAENKPKAEPFLMVPKALAARTDLRPIDKLLLADIRNRVGDNGRAWPGGRTLAADLGVNRDTILAGIARLEATGDLLVEKRGRGRTNHYRTPPASGQEPLPVEMPKRSRTLTSQNAGSGRKFQPVGKPKWPETPARGGRKLRPEVAGNSGPNKKEPLNKNQGEAAAPPVVDEKASPDGATGRTMATWCAGFKSRIGSAVAQGAKGRLAGTIKRLSADYSEADLSGAVSAWFAKDRGDYGVELFEKKLQGGDRDLLPRPEQSPPRDEYAERKLAELRRQRP